MGREEGKKQGYVVQRKLRSGTGRKSGVFTRAPGEGGGTLAVQPEGLGRLFLWDARAVYTHHL